MKSKIFITITLSLLPLFSYADSTLFLSPVTGEYVMGNAVPIKVMVGTAGTSVNAVEGKLVYDPTIMSVEKIDKEGSILQSWTIDPTQNNDTGELVFAGLTSTTSYSGERGLIMTVYIKGKRAQEGNLRFGSGSVAHAGDGTGENVLTSMNSGLFRFTPVENIPTSNDDGGQALVAQSEDSPPGGEVLGAATGTDPAATITSTTHPNSDSWYALSEAIFSFVAPSSTNAIALSFNDKPLSQGQTRYPASLQQKTIGDIKDGVWYFHLTEDRAEKSIHSHYKLQVDTTEPSVFELKEVARDAKDPRIKFEVNATDTVSGVDRFEFKVDQNSPQIWRDGGDHMYAFTLTGHGKHTLLGTVFDRAGNTKDASIEFEVVPLDTPQVSAVDSEQDERTPLLLSGTAFPMTTVRIYAAKDGADPAVETVTADDSGNFSYQSTYDLVPGVYTIAVDILDNRGAFSEKTAPFTLTVHPTLMGVIDRHPMIPVASISLILCAIVGFFVLRRMRNRKGEGNVEGQPVNTDPIEREACAGVVKSKGVLVPPSMPTPTTLSANSPRQARQFGSVISLK